MSCDAVLMEKWTTNTSENYVSKFKVSVAQCCAKKNFPFRASIYSLHLSKYMSHLSDGWIISPGPPRAKQKRMNVATSSGGKANILCDYDYT